MSFINPMLLLALPLALIPILIHLLNRLRYRSVAWAAISFIMKATRSSTSMARIRQWLILFLRVLAIALLVFALSRPLLSGWLGWKLAGKPERIIILLDRSATMGAKFNKDQNLLKRGLVMIMEAGKKNAPNSEILLIDSLNMKITRVPSWEVLAKIPQSDNTQASADFPLMFRSAVDFLLKNPSGMTEIWCVSDMQRSNWKPGSPEWTEIDEKLKALSVPTICKILKIKSNLNNNRSLSVLKVLSYSTDDMQKVNEVVLEVNRQDGEAEKEIPISLFVNNIAQQKSIKLKGENSIIRLPLPVSDNKQISIVSIKLPDDANLFDNNCFIAYGEDIRGKVVVVSKNSTVAELLAAAALPEDNNGENLKIFSSFSEINSGVLAGSALLLSDEQYPVDKKHLKILENFLKSGGCLISFASDSSVINDSAPFVYGKIKEYPEDKPMNIIAWKHHEGPLADSVSGKELPLEQLKIFKLRTLLKGDVKPYAMCADGRPFLYRKLYGKHGVLYFCTLSILSNWSNLSEGPVLVPMLSRLRKKASERFSKIVFRECGKWNYNTQLKIPISLKTSENEKKYLPDSGMAGIYLYNEKYNVLNRPLIENDLDRMNKSQITSLLKHKKIYLFTEKAGENSSLQTEIWRWMLIFMFCFLMVESFMLTPNKEVE
jgi:hypothetical protein